MRNTRPQAPQGLEHMDKKLPSPVFWVVKAESVFGFALSGKLARRGCWGVERLLAGARETNSLASVY